MLELFIAKKGIQNPNLEKWSIQIKIYLNYPITFKSWESLTMSTWNLTKAFVLWYAKLIFLSFSLYEYLINTIFWISSALLYIFSEVKRDLK